ncbi:hypothetical protein ARMGADRAFT_292373 [Armillaria gallica]|uniref:Uncharacterized protein n=1 Tax=Armillaria gallica TaxID=47427 RepID=A0A2H3D9J1_ARMGA|nr:hypothetical protein ARMGADRAFT_292373 [Armillaria gallica]
MFAYFHDCHSAHEFDDLFGPLSAGRHVLSKDYVGLVPNLDLVLTLDFGLLPVLTIDNMETELTRFLHTTPASFTDKYSAELNGRTHKCMPFFDPGYCLQDVMVCCQSLHEPYIHSNHSSSTSRVVQARLFVSASITILLHFSPYLRRNVKRLPKHSNCPSSTLLVPV